MQPVAETGALLADRYRLDSRYAETDAISLWRATDEVLGRSVGIRMITGQTRTEFRELAGVAARAGQVSDARWVRVLDVGSEAHGRLVTGWVVSEWVEGPSLAAIIRDEPLRPAVATGLILSCAEAIIAAQRLGCRHGALHADEILLPGDGSPRLTGLELSVALRPTPSYDDTRGLGALLFAALTGRWPLLGWDGLPAPSRGDGLHPRQQRKGINRELDEITARALNGDYAGTAAFARALSGLPVAPLNPAPLDPEERGNQRWRRVAWWLVPPVLVAAVGFGAWTVGKDLGRIPSPARAAAPQAIEPQGSSSAATSKLVWTTPPRITTLDSTAVAPNAGAVGLAVDADPSTQWLAGRSTTATFGAKKGIGLLLDLGHAKRVKVVDLLLSAPGSTVEIRAGDKPPQQASDLPVVASRLDSPAAVRLTLTKPVKARYWLVWFTKLPPAGKAFRLGVAEIELLR